MTLQTIAYRLAFGKDDEITLTEDGEDHAPADILGQLLNGLNVTVSREDELVPCFDIAELARRNNQRGLSKRRY